MYIYIYIYMYIYICLNIYITPQACQRTRCLLVGCSLAELKHKARVLTNPPSRWFLRACLRTPRLLAAGTSSTSTRCISILLLYEALSY